MKECSVDNCVTVARSNASGLCEKHYYRLRRRGSLQSSHREPTGQCLQCNEVTASIFCSDRCRRRHSRSRGEVARRCEQCTSPIPPEARSDKRFCSTKCYSKHRYTNIESVREYASDASRLRRARKRLSPGNFQQVEFERLCEFYGGKCLKCEGSGDLVPDHVIPLSRGGENWIANIQPLCSRCNGEKHVKTDDYRWDGGYYALTYVSFLIESGVDEEFNERFNVSLNEKSFQS